MSAAAVTDTRRIMQTRLVEKAWKDPEFRAQVLANPKGLLEQHLGQKLPEQLKIYVHEEDRQTLHFSIPPAPASVGELSDDELEKVAGGTELWIVIATMGIASAVGTAVGSAAGVMKTSGGW